MDGESKTYYLHHETVEGALARITLDLSPTYRDYPLWIEDYVANELYDEPQFAPTLAEAERLAEALCRAIARNDVKAAGRDATGYTVLVDGGGFIEEEEPLNLAKRTPKRRGPVKPVRRAA